MAAEESVLSISDNAGVSVRITIIQHMQQDYALYLWPSALVLADYVWRRRSEIVGKDVLELGCGTGLPGLVTAAAGCSRITFSDDARKPFVLETVRRACNLNCFPTTHTAFKPITWGHFTLDVLNLPSFDLVLAADCLYDVDDFESVIATIAILLGKKPHSRCWLVYQERSAKRSIQHHLDFYGLKATTLQWRDFSDTMGEEDEDGNDNEHVWSSVPAGILESLFLFELINATD